jgi:hypothetical protein
MAQIQLDPGSIKAQAYFTAAWLMIALAVKNLIVLARDLFDTTLIVETLEFVAGLLPILIYVMIFWLSLCVFLYVILLIRPQKEDPEYW